MYAVPQTLFESRRQAQHAVAELKPDGLGYRQFQILVFGREYLEVHGCSPSYRIIGDALGMEKSDVGKAVLRLEQRGLAMREGSGREPRLRLKSPGVSSGGAARGEGSGSTTCRG